MLTKKVFWQGLVVMGVILAFWSAQFVKAQQAVESTTIVSSHDPVVGDPFTISWNGIDETYPVVTYNNVDQEYLVIWWNNWFASDDMYAYRLNERGQLLSWFAIADGFYPTVAFNEKNNTYLAVYTKLAGSDYDIYGRRFNYAGPLGPEFPIAWNLDDDEQRPRVAYNTHPAYDEFLVVWENVEILPVYSEMVEGIRIAGADGNGDGGGQTIGARLSIAVNTGKNREPDVAYNLNMNQYLVVYTNLPAGGTNLNVNARRVTGNGVLLNETVIDSSGNDQDHPKVAADRLNQATPYLVVFNDLWNDPSGDVRGYLVDQKAEPVLLINLSTGAGEIELDPTIGYSEAWGKFVVSWANLLPGDTHIFGRLVRSDGWTYPVFMLTEPNPTPMNCNRESPQAALGQVSGMVVWNDDCGIAGGWDVVGRMLGYRTTLPLTIR